MSEKNVILRRIATIVLVIIIMALAAYLVIRWAEQSRSELPILGKVIPFNFVAHTGEPYGRDDMLGNITVVDFIFTRCLGPCPIMCGHMEKLYRLYASSDKIRFVSISVDPEHDSLAVLSEFAQKKGVTDKRWLFLRGNIKDVKLLSEQGFMLASDDLPGGHSTKFILVDDNGNIRGYYNGTDETSLDILKTHINQLYNQLQ
ncbi:MAG: SCO family protein [Candidatus Zixiibacteriota bacterium]